MTAKMTAVLKRNLFVGENLPFVNPDDFEDFEIQNDVQNETCSDNNNLKEKF